MAKLFIGLFIDSQYGCTAAIKKTGFLYNNFPCQLYKL